MLPSIDPLGRRTAAVALRHSLYLAPIGLLAWMAEVVTWPFAVEAAAMSAAIAVYAARFAASPSPSTARSMFKFSLLYLPALLALMAVHRLPNTHSVGWAEVEAKARDALAATMSSSGAVGGAVAEAMDSVVAAVHSVVSRIDGDAVLSYVTKCPSKVQCKDIPDRALPTDGPSETAPVDPFGRTYHPHK